MAEAIKLFLSSQIEMNKAPEKPQQGRMSHTPLSPQQEIQLNFHAIKLFAPMAIKYLARHLTVGSYIRLRRMVLRRFERIFYV